MRYRILLTMAICIACQLFPAFSQTTFSSFESFLAYAEEKSIALKSEEIAITEAKKQKLTGILGILDPRGGGRLSYVNNTRLPVTLVPSELVGGQSGSFENVQFGLQYETQFAAEIDIKLLNLAGWSEMSLTKIRIDLEENNKQISRKELFDHAATLYYQILSLQAQELSAQTNLEKADSIRQSVILRLEKGLASQQEVNEAEVNYLKLAQSETDISYLTDLQYQALKILCDIPEKENIQILPGKRSMKDVKQVDILSNELQIKQAFLNEQYARVQLRKSKLEFAPTLSFLGFHSQQQFNDRGRLFDSSVDWIPSTYIGLRLNIPLPGSRQIASNISAKYDFLLAQESRKQAVIQSANEKEKLATTHMRASAKEASMRAIYQLKKDTYEKNYLSYQQGVMDLTQTLNSFQDMVNAEYSWIGARLEVEEAKMKIQINNTIR